MRRSRRDRTGSRCCALVMVACASANRENIGAGLLRIDCAAASPVSSLEPHPTSPTSPSYPSTAGHVLACSWESRPLRQHIRRSGELPRLHPLCAQRCAATALPPVAPKALLVLEALDTPQQQEEAHRVGPECHDRSQECGQAGKRAEEAEGAVNRDIRQQRALCAPNKPPARRRYVAWICRAHIRANIF
jgi:hypothetical protein